MTGLTAADFADFYRSMNAGRPPFAWQVRLVEHLMSEHRWPDRIDAPTGAGKSAVVEAHVFAVAATTAARRGGGHDLPRRLAVTVDRRALVDGHAERAATIARELAASQSAHDAPEVVRAVASALQSLRPPGDSVEPVEVAVLRGGMSPSRRWVDAPTACQVIAATPDMWGSRLLFNGYGSSRWAHPREAGLLAFDTAVVLDEGHLNQQLLRTAKRVRDLTANDARALGVPALQVTQMTATPARGGETAVGVLPADLTEDTLLGTRLRTPKPLRLRSCEHWPATRGTEGRLVEVLVDEIRAALAVTGGTVGCVVNTVRLATAVTSRLRQEVMADGSSSMRVAQIVGRMRPWDLAALRREHPGLFGLRGDSEIDVLVATQAVEVGVDMDFAALVTELAPGTALAQRAGRVNRAGSRATGPVTVVVPTEKEGLVGKTVGPYQGEELAEALEWLNRRAVDPAGVAPWAIHEPAGGDAPPPAPIRRPVLHRPELWDAELWARTSDALFADHDLDLWLSDDLDPEEFTAAVVVRQGLPADILRVPELLRATPPQAHEMFPARLGELHALIRGSATAAEPHLERLFVMREDEVTPVAADGMLAVRLGPEDIVVVDDTARVFRAHVVSREGDEVAVDVSERAGAALGGTVRFHTGAPILDDVERPSELLSQLRQAVAEDIEESESGADTGTWPSARATLAGWLAAPRRAESASPDSLQLLGALLAADAEITVQADPDEDFWVVVTGDPVRRDDEEARQSWTPQRGPVSLGSHQFEVQQAARRICSLAGVNEPAPTAVAAAGLLHDEGKADPRFQRALRNRDADYAGRVLAKSSMRSMQAITRARLRSGLPTGWRHEQLSAAIAWERLPASEPSIRDLATRLVGTSHGRGRSGFLHTAEQLVPMPTEAALELFAEAEWDLLLERTHRDWGLWGCAYLEALLRAADGTVSRGGS